MVISRGGIALTHHIDDQFMTQSLYKTENYRNEILLGSSSLVTESFQPHATNGHVCSS